MEMVSMVRRDQNPPVATSQPCGVFTTQQGQTRIPLKGQRELRRGRFSQKNAFYFITTCCYKKQKIFTERENVEFLDEALQWLQGNGYIDLYFYIAMPDHVHLVFQLTGDKDLSQLMKSLKQYTGRRIRSRMGSDLRIWQAQYYEHRIRKGEDLKEIMRYCWYNPVRAGIVADPRDYPFWWKNRSLPSSIFHPPSVGAASQPRSTRYGGGESVWS
ncbi:hypothetical protein DRP53_04425 [candidate division WOR-3 bacterium]|uniref:Transposase IS200-like domain-containing protein n=1 Tax=candidate division WOR-3 bacterium TaxID=2052148 RepID=A0A660SIX0_UNCW3|nr:MAG: hypothetical protein DRP53_04425 [candidate division WOR-3 bacterium]